METYHRKQHIGVGVGGGGEEESADAEGGGAGGDIAIMKGLDISIEIQKEYPEIVRRGPFWRRSKRLEQYPY